MRPHTQSLKTMEILSNHPGRRVVAYFAGTILVGSLLLFLPVSSADSPISYLDALFTATSAVCVTGLIVVDTGTAFSTFGQIVILVLIQLGGLGIMTFATLLLVLAGARLTVSHRLGLDQSFTTGGGMSSSTLLLAVIGMTLVIELIGGLLMFPHFNARFPTGEAAWHSAFHSVSAFCNAGFSTFPDSLESFNGSPTLILTFGALIIFGGLGFIVIAELLSRATGRTNRLSLHTKICLSLSAGLIVLGAVAFLVQEWNASLSEGAPGFKIVNAFFQSVTCRTAGFNTTPQRELTEVSLLLTMALMFIGGCPGSTAGGIKVTTIAIVFLTVYSRFRGRRSVSAFKRSINNESIIRAVSVFILASLIVLILFGGLMLAWEQTVRHTLSHGWFADNLFETVSAFGTVGLSLGLTPDLTPPGKIIIVVAMFIGRVGLLTLAFAFARPRARGELTYAEETVMVG